MKHIPNINQVFEGWRNNLIPPAKLKKIIKEVSQERMSVCNDCTLNSKNRVGYHSLRIDEHCTECGCTLAALTKCLSCHCESGKWLAVVTPEQEQQMKNEKESNT